MVGTAGEQHQARTCHICSQSAGCQCHKLHSCTVSSETLVLMPHHCAGCKGCHASLADLKQLKLLCGNRECWIVYTCRWHPVPVIGPALFMPFYTLLVLFAGSTQTVVSKHTLCCGLSLWALVVIKATVAPDKFQTANGCGHNCNSPWPAKMELRSSEEA